VIGIRFAGKRSYGDFDQVGRSKGDRLLEFDHYRRCCLLNAHDAFRDWPDKVGYYASMQFVEAYSKYKVDEGFLDFTDLLEQIDVPLDVDVIFCDEAQDLSKLQWRAFWIIAAQARRVILAGDDDQAVFTWAGADPASFVAQKADAVHILDQSYRVPSSVHEVALRLTHLMKGRQIKDWSPRPVQGEVRTSLTPEGALDYLSDTGSILILYRSHFQMRGVEQRLRSLGQPYNTIWGPGHGLEWGPAIRYWERLRADKVPVTAEEALIVITAVDYEDHDVAQKLENMPSLLQVSLSDLEQPDRPWYEALTKIKPADRQYLRNLLSRHKPSALTDVPRIKLSTIHSAKGTEADHVILNTDLSKRCKELIWNAPGTEERVFYVGVTRAKETLTICGNTNPLF
jgi:DNA helicase-2/ATP-dependent DNA helicase PcrA